MSTGVETQDELSEARLRQLVRHLPFFAVLIDREHRYTWINRLDSTLSLSSVIGESVEAHVHPSCRDVVSGAIEHAFETRTVTYYEARAYADGEMETWYGVRIIPLPPDEQGRVLAFLLSSDITQRRDAESALRESEERFRLLTEASPDYVVIVDHERRCEYVNRMPPAEGIARERALGCVIDEFLDPADRPRFAERVQRVLDRGCSASFDIRGPATGRPYTCRVVPLATTDGRPRALMVTTDVGEQRAAEAHRRTLEARLSQAQKMESIGQLAGGVAHDFNNMIMVMGLHLEAAREFADNGQLDGTRRELDEIEAAAKRAAELTRRLLAFARRQPHQPRVVLGAELTASSMHLLSRLIPASIRLELRMRAADAWVTADPALIEQVIVNLCVNARDAIGEHRGTITVEVDRREVSTSEPQASIPAGRWVTIAVHDTGHGIAEVDLPRIFEPFFTTKPTGQGTGLGLAMVHGIVTQHQGFVTVDSKPNQGARFTIYLPEVVSAAPSAQRDVPRTAPSSRARILVAEDEPMVRRLVANLLRRAGHAVVEAENGVQALRIVQTSPEPFDLLVLDAVMPEMGGKECFERIHELYPNLPAIFSSGYAADMLPAPFLARHGLHLIPKPYDSKTLLDAVDEAVARSRAPARTSATAS